MRLVRLRNHRGEQGELTLTQGTEWLRNPVPEYSFSFSLTPHDSILGTGDPDAGAKL